jgi:hypothetical protein
MNESPRGTRRRLCASWGALFCTLAVTPVSAWAEARPQNNGIKLGENARLHVQADVDSRYSSNPGRISPDDNRPNVKVTPDMLLSLRPAADLDMAGGLLELKGKLNLEYQQYLGISCEPGKECTDQLSTFFFEFGLETVTNKNGHLVLRASDNARRSADPGQSLSDRIEHTANELVLDVEYKPGGGALIFNFGYSFFYDRYDRIEGFQSQLLDNMRHTPRLRGSWKFLPKTAVFIEGGPSWTIYPYDGEFVNTENGSTVGNEDTMTWNAQAGAQGAVTSKIAATLKAGYGGSLTSSGHEGSIVGMAELRYGFTETQKAMVSYTRSVQPTSLFRYVSSDRVAASYNQAIGGRVQVSGQLSYSLLTFGQVANACTNTTARGDVAFSGTLGVDLQVNEMIMVSIADNYEQRDSNCKTAVGSAGYRVNEAYLRGSFRY